MAAQLGEDIHVTTGMKNSLGRGALALAVLGCGLLGGPLQQSTPASAQEVDCENPDNASDSKCRPSDAPPAVDAVAKAGDPNQIIFTLDDAGKEATQFVREEGTDNRGRWAHSRYERDRDLGASRQGPNVIDSRAWIARDVEAAKAVFRDQSVIKDFPDRNRREPVEGINDPFMFGNVGEETAFVAGYWVDNTVWHHYRVVVRKGSNVALMYLFGRRDVVKNEDAMWFAQKLAGRL